MISYHNHSTLKSPQKEQNCACFQWYRSASNTWGGGTPEAISGATNRTYTPSGADVGKYLYFEVTPSNGTLAGTKVQSAASGIVSAAPDNAAPVIAPDSGTANRSGDTAATIGFTTGEGGTAYYIVKDSGTAAPVKPSNQPADAGWTTLGAVGAGVVSNKSIAVSAGAKDVYVVVVDAAGNVSDPLKITVSAYNAPPAQPTPTPSRRPVYYGGSSSSSSSGSRGYIDPRYLRPSTPTASPEPAPPPEPLPAEGEIIAKKSVTVLDDDSKKGKPLGTLEKDDKITILGFSGDYAVIAWDGGIGYIPATDIAVPFGAPLDVIITKNGWIYSRGLEKKQYRLTTLKKNRKLTVTGRNGRWFWITAEDGTVTWIPASIAKAEKEYGKETTEE